MKRHTLRTPLAALALALLFTIPALAGVVYEIEVKDHGQSTPKTESIEAAVEGRHLKMGIAPRRPGEKGGEMIFRGDRREVVVVDHDERTYHVMDEAAIRSLAGQVGSAMGSMQDALKNLPPDKRKEIEDAMKRNGMGGGLGAMGAAPQRSAPEVRRTGERATKAGYPCVKYEVYQDGRKIRELWVTDWSNVEGGGEARDAFKDMADFFQEMLDSLGDGAGFFEGIDSVAKNFENGFPVETRGFDEGGGLEDESVLRSARRQRLDPAAFEPPSGYKRMSMGPR